MRGWTRDSLLANVAGRLRDWTIDWDWENERVGDGDGDVVVGARMKVIYDLRQCIG